MLELLNVPGGASKADQTVNDIAPCFNCYDCYFCYCPCDGCYVAPCGCTGEYPKLPV